MNDEEQVPDPLILELVPDGDNVRPVLVKKCPPGVPQYRDSLNQRGHEAWPEITCWPHSLHYSLYAGLVKPISSDPHSWSTQFWSQEIYMIRQEMKEHLLKVLNELSKIKAFPRSKATKYEIEPRPEDFGERWYRELQEMKKKRRR